MAGVAAAIGAGLVLAWAVTTFLSGMARTARQQISHARGADRPAWAPGIWFCARCRSTNVAAATRCGSCRRPREEFVHAPVAARPDWIPERIDASPATLVHLLHDPAAHADPTAAHWKVIVGRQMVGSAAHRDGALALLRAIEGADTIALDVRGTGPAEFRIADLVARFEVPAFRSTFRAPSASVSLWLRPRDPSPGAPVRRATSMLPRPPLEEGPPRPPRRSGHRAGRSASGPAS